jgi:hypothetical protein
MEYKLRLASMIRLVIIGFPSLLLIVGINILIKDYLIDNEIILISLTLFGFWGCTKFFKRYIYYSDRVFIDTSGLNSNKYGFVGWDKIESYKVSESSIFKSFTIRLRDGKSMTFTVDTTNKKNYDFDSFYNNTIRQLDKINVSMPDKIRIKDKSLHNQKWSKYFGFFIIAFWIFILLYCLFNFKNLPHSIIRQFLLFSGICIVVLLRIFQKKI